MNLSHVKSFLKFKFGKDDFIRCPWRREVEELNHRPRNIEIGAVILKNDQGMASPTRHYMPIRNVEASHFIP